jgi:hypothetical protein
MAKQGGLGDNFYIGGYDLSGDVASLDTLSTPWDVIDFTVIKDSAHERQLTLRTADLQFTTFFDQVGTGTAAPGVPGSNTPLVSTYNWSVLVQIIGGTMTNVSINGVTVGTGAGVYVLPPLGTIQMTYSVAPTWAWTVINAEHQVLGPLPTSDVIASYFRGQAIGNPAFCMGGKQVNYDWTRDTTANLQAKIEVQGSNFGGLWGLQATPGIRLDTAPTLGASNNDTAATAFGAEAYLHIFSFLGTSIDIAVQDSANNSTWANVTGLDFGAQTTAPYTARLATANNATLRQYVAVNTTGTFTYCRFAVMYRRNPVAGVSF